MPGTNPQPAVAASPADPAGAPVPPAGTINSPAAAGPTWPIALAVWCMAYAAYGLAEFILNVLPNPKLWIGILTGSAPMGGPREIVSLIRIGFALSGLTPLLLVLLLACAAAICLRRRWALWALGAWALLDLLLLLAVIVLIVLQLRSMPLLYLTWALVSSAPYEFLLPGAVLLFLCRGKTRRQFRVWSDNCLPVPRPVWPVVIGWLSMFIAVSGLNTLIRDLGLIAVSYYLARTGYLGYIGQQWPAWLVVHQMAGILPFLAMTALALQAVALLKRRPNSAQLHVIGACLVLASLLVGPIVVIIIDAIYHPYMTSQDPPIAVYGKMFLCTIYPMFLLFWFLRPGVRQQVAGWR